MYVFLETEHFLPQYGIPEDRQIPAHIRLAASGQPIQQENGSLHLRLRLPRDKFVEHIPKGAASGTGNGVRHRLQKPLRRNGIGDPVQLRAERLHPRRHLVGKLHLAVRLPVSLSVFISAQGAYKNNIFHENHLTDQ